MIRQGRSLRSAYLVIGCLCLALPSMVAALPDPSVLISVIIDDDHIDGLIPAHAYANSLEGGPTGHFEDAGREINTTNLQVNGGIDVPTGAKPSPLYGAQAFTQMMLRYEEFGPKPLGAATSTSGGSPFPSPTTTASGPDYVAMDSFLGQEVSGIEALPVPYPTVRSNVLDLNPWSNSVASFLGRPVTTSPAEGRPPGISWAHQRWAEFMPEQYFVTAQAGAHDNSGLRDSLQMHQYSHGEFAPGGLYHNVAGPDVAGNAQPQFDGTAAGAACRLHPAFPMQGEQSVWTFDGTFPPKLLMARYGKPILFRHYNALPIDPSSNNGFGLHTLTTHEHNGHNPSESDGYAQSFFFPGQFYDYHWPMVVAGHDSINANANDVRMGTPDGNGGIEMLPGDYREVMSSHWFHDHMLDFTAQNVYKGNAATMNYYSAIDRGNESINDGVNLRLPSGSALDWGNRDYDVNLTFADKAWDSEGQLFFNIFNLDGFLGDQMVCNWLWKPYLDVRARRYRFRLLNGAVSRYMRIALVEEVQGTGGAIEGGDGSGLSYNLVPFHMIANDGNIMEHSVAFDGTTTWAGYENRLGTLPEQAIAERYDIVVDFSQFNPGTKLFMVNLLEHKNGKRPNEDIPIEEVLNGDYHDRSQAPFDQPTPGANNRYDSDPCVTRVLEFVVHEYSGTDLSMDPADYVSGNGNGPGGADLKMLPLPTFTQAELDGANRHTFSFGRSNGTDQAPWTQKTDGGGGLYGDTRRISTSVNRSQVELWTLKNGGGGWAHPIHIHFEEGQIISRGGAAPPEWERWARKDVYRIGPADESGDEVVIALRFREFVGSYVEHCHNTQHEDHAMLMRWDIENPGQVLVMPTPMPSWDGVSYVQTYALSTHRTGDPDAVDDDEGRSYGHLLGR